MDRVSKLLDLVWSNFRRAGIVDDLSIIEHIAALLLANSGVELSKDEAWPRKPPAQLDPKIEDIKKYLAEAADQVEVGRAATLFDSYVLFRLPNMLPGGRYPTPRHIVKSMLRLIKVESNHRVADFACGSAGFLVRRPLADQLTENLTLGIDISPEWTKLARANTILHGLSSATIKARNALQVFDPDGELSETTFERILMNSPFGEKVDEKLAERTLGQKIGSRSETVLTVLALKKLAEGGQAALLVPLGLLLINSKGEQELRRQLVHDHELDAVVSLPKEALQPYSPLQTNLLLVRKSQPSEESLTWFLQVEQDGYPAGRGRDLTKDPDPSKSDLPFLEGVLINRATHFDFVLPDEATPQVGIRRVVEDNNLLGLVCQGILAELTSVDLYPQPSQATSAFLLAEITTQTAEQRVCVCVPLNGDEPSLVENRVQLIQKLYQSKRQEFDPGTRLLSQTVKAVAIAISSGNQTVEIDKVRLLGVAVQRDSIQEPVYDLRPERYVGKQQESRSTDSPAKLLANIYKNQQKLLQHIDSLFSRLELPPISDQEELPSRLIEIEPFGTLSREQQEVWEQVRKETEPARNDHSDEYLTAVHFTPEKLSTISSEEVSDTTHLTLELLERMGVIVHVTIADPNTSEPVALYRRVTERDLWQLDSEESDLEGESG